MITTILFDLDGTLLPMNQDHFVNSYLSRMAQKMAPHGYDPKKLVSMIWNGTGAMVANNGQATNETVFWDFFEQVFGADSRKDEPLFQEFYHHEFQEVRNECGFTPAAAELIRELQQKGFTLVLATNPLFPAIATQSRVRWAGLEPEDFVWITTYENSSYCKPNPAYYREILAKLNKKPEECLMVGNDVGEDMIVKDLGMQVFLLTDCLINKKEVDISVYPHGGFPELAAFIRRL